MGRTPIFIPEVCYAKVLDLAAAAKIGDLNLRTRVAYTGRGRPREHAYELLGDATLPAAFSFLTGDTAWPRSEMKRLRRRVRLICFYHSYPFRFRSWT